MKCARDALVEGFEIGEGAHGQRFGSGEGVFVGSESDLTGYEHER